MVGTSEFRFEIRRVRLEGITKMFEETVEDDVDAIVIAAYCRFAAIVVSCWRYNAQRSFLGYDTIKEFEEDHFYFHNIPINTTVSLYTITVIA